MENTYETAPATTIGGAIAERMADTIREDGVGKTANRMFRALVLIGFCIAAAAPQFMWGYVVATATWKGAALTKIICIVGAFCYYRHMIRLWNWIRARRNRKDPDGNQHTYHGIPIEQMADYLIEQKGFPREQAIVHFGISRKRQFKIADELEKHHVLERGECHARVLNGKITREQLVRQLRDKFPLAWSDSLQEWGERKGSFETWILQKDAAERRDQEQAERLERKVGRLQRKREELQDDIQTIEQATRAPGFFTRAVSAV